MISVRFSSQSCKCFLKQCYMTFALRYPSLRVAYVEEREEIVLDVPKKVYYSILVKAVNGFDQVSITLLLA